MQSFWNVCLAVKAHAKVAQNIRATDAKVLCFVRALQAIFYLDMLGCKPIELLKNMFWLKVTSMFMVPE